MDPDVQHYSKIFRIMISSIHNLGCCPCPHCLITLDCVPNMGKHRDILQRRTLARIDNVRRRNLVKAAHEKIYEKNYVVDSKAVGRLLQEESLVPTAVCLPLLHGNSKCSPCTECIFKQVGTVWLQHVRHAHCRYYARIRTWCLEGRFYPFTTNSRLPE